MIAPLREVVGAFGRLLDGAPDEPRILSEGGALLRTLVARDDWLPEAFAKPDPTRYQQFLLHADSTERFLTSRSTSSVELSDPISSATSSITNTWPSCSSARGTRCTA